MGRQIFDIDSGEYIYTVSDTLARDSDGHMLMKMGNRMAMDMDSGELHFLCGSWDEDDE